MIWCETGWNPKAGMNSVQSCKPCSVYKCLFKLYVATCNTSWFYVLLDNFDAPGCPVGPHHWNRPKTTWRHDLPLRGWTPSLAHRWTRTHQLHQECQTWWRMPSIQWTKPESFRLFLLETTLNWMKQKSHAPPLKEKASLWLLLRRSTRHNEKKMFHSLKRHFLCCRFRYAATLGLKSQSKSCKRFFEK